MPESVAARLARLEERMRLAWAEEHIRDMDILALWADELASVRAEVEATARDVRVTEKVFATVGDGDSSDLMNDYAKRLAGTPDAS